MATETIQATDHKLYVAGEWMETGEWSEVNSPYDGTLIGRVPKGDAALVGKAVEAARAAFDAGEFPAHERAAVLDRAAELVGEREDDLTMTIAAEAGKPVKTARVEAQRCVSTMQFSAVAARTLTGHTVPMEAGAAGEGKLGIVIRVPYGVVGAISPFNFPLNLVGHKLGPAIAAGNAIVLKPAGQTPISAIKLAEILYDAGLPENWLQVVCGSGSDVGNAIVEDDRIGAITFTGSAPVGWSIRSKAPHKKVNLELGSSAPLIVNEDGDWETAADKAKLHAYSHAGQSCISIQRILLHESIADQFTERFVNNVESLVTGDPMDENTDVGPVISQDDRDRVKEWIDEAASQGGEILTGGELVDEDRCIAPDGDPGRAPRVPHLEGRDLRARWRRSTPSRRSTRPWRWRTTPATACRPASSPATSAMRRRPARPSSSAASWSTRCRPSAPTRCPTAASRTRATPARAPHYAVRELTEERLVTIQG